MGVGKAMSYGVQWAFSGTVVVLTVLFAIRVYRRRQETGFLLLVVAFGCELVAFAARALDFLATDWEIRRWILGGAFILHAGAPILVLISLWLLGSNKALRASAETPPGTRRRDSCPTD
jgi:hypothetical protein